MEIRLVLFLFQNTNVSPDSKVNAVNMEPIWGRQDPGGPHVGPMKFVIWVNTMKTVWYFDSICGK